MLRKSQRAVWTAVFLASIVLCGCGDTGAETEDGSLEGVEYVFSYAENQPEGYPTTKGAMKFASLVEERSGGRIRILVEANAELGDEEAVFEQLSFGGIDFARISLSTVSESVPDLKILMLPYLYHSREHMWNVLDGPLGSQFLEYFEGTGCRALSWYDAGARSFYTSSRQIRSPEDMAGLKIRIQNSDIMRDVITALGAEPVQSVYSDVYGLLELGEIDGAENNLASYMAERHYQQAPYYTMDEHSRIPEVQLVSEETWSQLDEEDRLLIAQCARESALYERSLWEEYEAEALKKAQEAGCRIIWLTDQERRAFEERTAGIYQSYFPEQAELMEQIQNAQ